MDAVTSDPGWNGGDYAAASDVPAGLARHADIWAVMGLTTDVWKSGFWRDIPPVVEGLGWETFEEFQQSFTRLLFGMMDSNALLTMGWKWQRCDVARHTDGNLAAALGRVTAKVFVIPIDQDMFFPPRDCEAEQQLTPGTSGCSGSSRATSTRSTGISPSCSRVLSMLGDAHAGRPTVVGGR